MENIDLDHHENSESDSTNGSTIEAKKTKPVKEKKPRSAAQIAATEKMLAAKRAKGNIALQKKEVTKQIREAEEILLAKKKEKMERKVERANAIKDQVKKVPKQKQPVVYDDSSESESSEDELPPIKRRSKKPIKVIINNTHQPPVPTPVPVPIVKDYKPNYLFV
jgi:hypothetical protein